MRSLVIGASGGIGAALVAELSLQGEAVGLSRSRDGLDITDEAVVAETLGRLTGQFDIIFIATGALELDGARPEKSLRAISFDAMAAQLALNAIGPVLVVKHALSLLPKDRQARIGVLSARVGSIGDNALGGWYSYRAAKAALNQFIHTASIEVARSHPQAVLACLHPGTVATDLTRSYSAGHPAVTSQKAARYLVQVLQAMTPAQTGTFADWRGDTVPW